MRTTKEERARLAAKYSNRKDYDGDVRDDVARLLDDVDALTTIALAAGLGADASAAEVAARVGEMRGALVAIGRYDEFDRKRLAPTAHAYGHHAEAVDFARRLAEEAGRG